MSEVVGVRESSFNVIQMDGLYVVVQEGKVHEPFPVYGEPGGGKEPGETYEECAVREALEETGLEIEIDQEVGWYYQKMSRNGHQLLRRVFQSHVIGGDLTVSTRHPDIQLINYHTAKDWHKAGLLRTNIDIESIADHHRGAKRPSTRQRPITVPSQPYLRHPRTLAS